MCRHRWRKQHKRHKNRVARRKCVGTCFAAEKRVPSAENINFIQLSVALCRGSYGPVCRWEREKRAPNPGRRTYYYHTLSSVIRYHNNKGSFLRARGITTIRCHDSSVLHPSTRLSTTTHIAPCFFWVAPCFSSLFSLPNTECHCSAAPFSLISLKLLANKKYFLYVRSQYKCSWK